MTWRELIKNGIAALQKAGIQDTESDARVLAMHVLGCGYSELILHMTEEADETCRTRFEACISERTAHKPCQYITGVQNFMGYDFRTAPGVLIPRPETEILVEHALSEAERYGKHMNKKDSLRVLDLCCGSGCIGISFACIRRESGITGDKVELADISDAAIALSMDNNQRLQAGCHIIQSDLFAGLYGKYDIIISNPPYIPTDAIPELMQEVRDFEPHLALDGKKNGLYFYEKIIREAREYLYEDGVLLFEIGYDQMDDVWRLLVENGYTNIKGYKDYAGHNRVVTGIKPGN